ncbi:MAG: DUF2179 domain-containing protein [Salinivirgaceae bacterium]|nr:DUF2179 domain-containing protein [Salinivirgaceae bacterium]
MNFDYYSYIILPLLIFVARITDVSIGTVRIILVAKGYKKLAPICGFIETLIWVVAISNIIQNIDNWACYIGYAAGFATGNYIGMIIESKLALGHELIRIISTRTDFSLADSLRSKGFGATVTKANGLNGEVSILYLIVTRRMVDKVAELVKELDPSAIYTIESIRFVNRSTFYGENESVGRRRLLLKYK